MFGAICAGRLVQTNLEQVDQNKFVFQLPDAASINHITVFLLPEIFFSWPGRPFQLLGALSNAKPSAIFRLGGTSQSAAAAGQGVTASLGISIEPLAAVETQVAQLPKHSTTAAVGAGAGIAPEAGALVTAPPTAAVLTTRIVKNLYNFLGGYSVTAEQITPTDQFVPLRAFQEWHSKFTHKIQMDASFLERDQD